VLASFAAVTASSTILAVTTASAASLAAVTASFDSLTVVTSLFLILGVVIASSAILSVVTAPLAIVAVVTVPALGEFRFTVDPIVMMKKSAPLEGAAANIMSLLSIAKPSLGWLVPLLGF
jgi:hypothetical protein